MGIFDFLKFGNCKRYADSFAMDRQSLYRLFRPALEQQLELPRTIVIAAHFPDEFFALQDRLADWEIDYQIITRPLDRQWLQDQRSEVEKRPPSPPNQAIVYLALAEFLIDTSFDVTESTDLPLALMMFDRHPDVMKDDGVLAFAESFPARSELGYFLALNDVVVQNVVNEPLLNLLKTFGAEDQGLITSNMVSKRLEKVLRRHAAKRTAAFESADSASNWYELNGLPDR